MKNRCTTRLCEYYMERHKVKGIAQSVHKEILMNQYNSFLSIDIASHLQVKLAMQLREKLSQNVLLR